MPFKSVIWPKELSPEGPTETHRGLDRGRSAGGRRVKWESRGREVWAGLCAGHRVWSFPGQSGGSDRPHPCFPCTPWFPQLPEPSFLPVSQASHSAASSPVPGLQQPSPPQFHHASMSLLFPGRASLLHWSVRHRGRQKTPAGTETGRQPFRIWVALQDPSRSWNCWCSGELAQPTAVFWPGSPCITHFQAAPLHCRTAKYPPAESLPLL